MNWYPVVLNGSGMKALWAAEITAHKGAEEKGAYHFATLPFYYNYSNLTSNVSPSFSCSAGGTSMPVNPLPLQ